AMERREFGLIALHRIVESFGELQGGFSPAEELVGGLDSLTHGRSVHGRGEAVERIRATRSRSRRRTPHSQPLRSLRRTPPSRPPRSLRRTSPSRPLRSLPRLRTPPSRPLRSLPRLRTPHSRPLRSLPRT